MAFIAFIALLIELLLNPMVTRLCVMHRYMPRFVAAGVSILTFLVIALTLLTVVTSTLAASSKDFATDLPTLTTGLRELFASSAWLSQQIEKIWTELVSLSLSALHSSLDVLISLFSKLFDLVMILFTTFYLLLDGRKIQRWVASLYPRGDRVRVFRLITDITRALHSYVYSQLMICLLMGMVVFIYYAWQGIAYAVVFGVLSGVSEFVPVVGPTIASAFGIAFTATLSPALAVQTFCFYLVITQMNHNLLYPTLVGQTLHLHPVAILLGILLGGCLLDAPGMFLAVPFMVVLRLLAADIYRASHR